MNIKCTFLNFLFIMSFFFFAEHPQGRHNKIHSAFDSIRFAFVSQGRAVKKKKKKKAKCTFYTHTHTLWNSLRSSFPLRRRRSKALHVFLRALCTGAARVSFFMSTRSRKCSLVALRNPRLLYNPNKYLQVSSFFTINLFSFCIIVIIFSSCHVFWKCSKLSNGIKAIIILSIS